MDLNGGPPVWSLAVFMVLAGVFAVAAWDAATHSNALGKENQKLRAGLYWEQVGISRFYRGLLADYNDSYAAPGEEGFAWPVIGENGVSMVDYWGDNKKGIRRAVQCMSTPGGWCCREGVYDLQNRKLDAYKSKGCS